LSPNELGELSTSAPPSPPGREGIRVSGTPHAPIIIDGDINFNATAQAEGWPGDGTSGDPFIIEGLDIDLGGGPGHGISISNTQVHFVIRNCNLTGASVNPGSGIYLYSVTNGLLINNTSTGNFHGIYLDLSDSNTLVNNTCASNYAGIRLSSSNSNTLSDNTCSSNSNGIIFLSANSNTVVNNSFTSNGYGVNLFNAHSNIVLDNTFTNSSLVAINLDTSDLNDFRWNVIVESNQECFDIGAGNTFVYNYWGSYSGSDVNQDGFGDIPHTLLGNSDLYPLVFSPVSPKWTQSLVDQTVEFGFFELNYDLDATAPAPMSWQLNNTLFSVDNEGVVTSRITLPVNIYGLEVVVTNIYGYSLRGSFKVRVQDTIAPHWIIEPSDQVFQHGEGFDYQLPVADLSGVAHWTLNDTSHFTLTTALYHEGSTARIINAIPLDPGVYGLNLTVYDPHGNRLSAFFSVIVEAEATSAIPGSIDPVMTLALGAGMGGAAVIVIVMLRRRPSVRSDAS
jgi:parallel beta-helix repeat protein